MKRPWDWELEAYQIAEWALDAYRDEAAVNQLPRVSQMAYTAVRHSVRLVAASYSLVHNQAPSLNTVRQLLSDDGTRTWLVENVERTTWREKAARDIGKETARWAGRDWCTDIWYGEPPRSRLNAGARQQVRQMLDTLADKWGELAGQQLEQLALGSSERAAIADGAQIDDPAGSAKTAERTFGKELTAALEARAKSEKGEQKQGLLRMIAWCAKSALAKSK